jgi:hypothetical protein
VVLKHQDLATGAAKQSRWPGFVSSLGAVYCESILESVTRALDG